MKLRHALVAGVVGATMALGVTPSATAAAAASAQCSLTPGAFDGGTVSAALVATAESGGVYTSVYCYVKTTGSSTGSAAMGLPAPAVAAVGLARIQIGEVFELCTGGFYITSTGSSIPIQESCGLAVGGAGGVAVA